MTAPSSELKPQIKPKPPAPSKTPVVPLVLGLFAAAVAFVLTMATGGNVASGLGRAAIVALAAAAISLVCLIVSIRKPTGVIGIKAPNWAIPIVFFVALGAVGLFLETPLQGTLGDSLKKDGKYQEAIVAYQNAGNANLKTGIPESYLLLGDQQVKAQNYAQAVESYRAVLSEQHSPNRYTDTARQQLSTAYLNWGLLLERDSLKTEEALDKYEAAIKAGGSVQTMDRARVQGQTLIARLGERSLQGGNFDKAINIYQRARDNFNMSELELKPYFSRTYLAWANKLFAAGDFQGAIDKLEPNLKLYPEGPEVNAYSVAIVDNYAGLGRKWVNDKQYQEVIKRIEPVFATYNKFDLRGQLPGILVTSFSAAGNDLETAKDWDKAITHYEKALTYTGNNASLRNDLNLRMVRVYNIKGDAQFAAKDYPKGVELYNKALGYAGANNTAKTEVNNRLFQLYVTWGEEYATANNTDKTVESYEKALQYIGQGDPRNNIVGRLTSLYLSQGEAFFAQNRFDRAVDILQKGLRQYPNPATNGAFRSLIAKSLYTWGEREEQGNNYASALERYRALLRDYGDQQAYTVPASEAQPRVLFSWAKSLDEAKQYAAAIARYQELVDRYGGSSQAGQARSALTAPQEVVVTVLDKNRKPAANLRIQLVDKWSLEGDSFTPTGRKLDFTTDRNGRFTARLAPGERWLLTYSTPNGYLGTFNGNQPRNLLVAEPLRGITSEQVLTLYTS